MLDPRPPAGRRGGAPRALDGEPGVLPRLGPSVPDRHFTIEVQRADIADAQRAWDEDRGYSFAILDPNERLVGRIGVSAVFRKAWQNANVGYFVAREHGGRGYATEALTLLVRFAFERAGLHRVQAAVMPRNAASIRVVDKAGFRREGLAKSYLETDGRWEDHLIYAITREDVPGSESTSGRS